MKLKQKDIWQDNIKYWKNKQINTIQILNKKYAITAYDENFYYYVDKDGNEIKIDKRIIHKYINQ